VRDVPASARGFDLRKKVAECIKVRFCKLQLACYRFYIEDPDYLGELGVYPDCRMRFAILEQGLCRLFFVLFGATRMATSDPMGQGITFSQIADLLCPDNPLGVFYEWQGRLLPRATLIKDIVCDPDDAIIVSCRTQFRLAVRFERDVKPIFSMTVTSATTTDDIQRAVWERYPDVESMSLHFRCSSLKSDAIRDRNLDLEDPVDVGCVKLGPVPFRFCLEGRPLTVKLWVDGATCGHGRAGLASLLRIPTSSLVVFDGELLLEDGAGLEHSKTYRVEVRNLHKRISVELFLVPAHAMK
jgi:hypothetical protein